MSEVSLIAHLSSHGPAMWCVTLGFPENMISCICIWRKGHRVPQSPLSWKISKSLSIYSLSWNSQSLWNSFSKLILECYSKNLQLFGSKWLILHFNNANKIFFCQAHSSFFVLKITSKNHIFDTDHFQVLWPDKLKSLSHSRHILFTLPPAVMRTARALRSLFP